MNKVLIKRIRKKCIYGIKVCICFFISWSIYGLIFGLIRLDNGYLFSSPLVCLLVFSFMYMVYKSEMKEFECDYK